LLSTFILLAVFEANCLRGMNTELERLWKRILSVAQ
jgi:hypothetical protein